ncbi:MAG TPA: hypothetical protein VKP69_02070 [Isosphaeraceae bacterium]|nr:hypothetical protein [Isosphaeraceae bacterium]
MSAPATATGGLHTPFAKGPQAAIPTTRAGPPARLAVHPRDEEREGSPLLVWVLGAVVPYAFLLSKWACWWAGWSFGPRFWPDTIPPLAILLGFALDWAVEHSRPAVLGFRAAVALSIGVQMIGAFYYPSSWNNAPVTVEVDHRRLWDWRDTELTRCLAEGLHPAGYRYWSPSALSSAIGMSRQAGHKPRALSIPRLARQGAGGLRR